MMFFQVSGVFHPMEINIAFYPINVGLFSADTIVFKSDNIANLIQQFWFSGN